jgi:hypothetical protein
VAAKSDMDQPGSSQSHRRIRETGAGGDDDDTPATLGGAAPPVGSNHPSETPVEFQGPF